VAITNAMTVDVEDYFHVSVFEGVVPRSQWTSMESRVQANTGRLLDLFDEHAVKGTFFVLGWVAERYPGLVRAIVQRGHELASHGYGHRLIYNQTTSGRRAPGQACSRTPGCGVRGRAPSFGDHPIDVLTYRWRKARYDASIFPSNNRYGIPDAPRWRTVSRPAEDYECRADGRMGAPTCRSPGRYFRPPYA
jgi:polysaccharide deacetylase family protein (PEP-CTERM system associated)